MPGFSKDPEFVLLRSASHAAWTQQDGPKPTRTSTPVPKRFKEMRDTFEPFLVIVDEGESHTRHSRFPGLVQEGDDPDDVEDDSDPESSADEHARIIHDDSKARPQPPGGVRKAVKRNLGPEDADAARAERDEWEELRRLFDYWKDDAGGSYKRPQTMAIWEEYATYLGNLPGWRE